MARRDRSTTEADIWVVTESTAQSVPDRIATEEALEIRLRTGAETRTLAVTMRTPGADAELAQGFLYAEGVLRGPEDVRRILRGRDAEGRPRETVLVVEVTASVQPDLAPLDRHFYTTSACGVCGKAGLDALLLQRRPTIPQGPRVDAETLYALPERLGAAQALFKRTGGLHAAALFDVEGNLLALREDVGRHNALDKLIGWAFSERRLPLHRHIVMVSGRSSYEILQKCLMAEVPVVCAVSAPSSLAVSSAREFGITLVGFLRDRRLNVYSGFERIRPSGD